MSGTEALFPGLRRWPREAAQAARSLLWAVLAGQWLRQISFLAIEQLVQDAGPRKLGLQTSFGDDALSYFTERLDPAHTRQALIDALHWAKRNKAFENSRCIVTSAVELVRLLWLSLGITSRCRSA